jgi:hypothetical protein
MTSQREGLYEQLRKHSADPEAYTNIFPLDDWTLSEYKVFGNFIHKGWLIQGDDYDKHYNGFIINPDWEGEPMWEEENPNRWLYIKEYLTREFSLTDWDLLEEYAREYDENHERISVDMAARECRDEDLIDYIQQCLLINDDEKEEEMDMNTKFGLMFMAKSVIEERTGTKLN